MSEPGSEMDKRRRRVVTLLLEEYDDAKEALKLRDETADPAVALEGLRNTFATRILSAIHEPEYSLRSALRDFMMEALQISTDVMVISEEAEALSRVADLEAASAVRAEWDAAEFGSFVTKLLSIRRTYLLGCAIVGPDLADKAARNDVDRLFPNVSLNRAHGNFQESKRGSPSNE